jgi:hypothetical protein
MDLLACGLERSQHVWVMFRLKLISLSVCAFVALVLPLRGEEVSAESILQGARMATTLAKLDAGLTGHLRKGGLKVPVTLFLKGADIQFQFEEPNQALRIFHMRVGEKTFQLFEIENGKTMEFPPEKLQAAIGGTDLTYEDLALRFFYWPNPKLEGTEDVGGQSCYKIRVDKPSGMGGRYQVVYVWVHMKFGAFMRIRGYDQRGGLLKEFQVESVMQAAKDVWTLRKMQVSTHEPTTGRRLSITDVVFETPRSKKPLGLE